MFNEMSKKKKIIIICSIVLVVGLIVFFIMRARKKKKQETSNFVQTIQQTQTIFMETQLLGMVQLQSMEM